VNAGGLLQRLVAAPRELSSDQRLAGLAAFGLLLSMFLPWYGKSTYDTRRGRFVSDTVSAFGAVSFVEAAVFLVAAGVLVLLFTRAERRQYELPGGDGTVVFGAGLWATLLIFWRVFDRPDVAGQGSTVGIQWGFFVAFVAAGSLALAGWRLRQHERHARQAARRPGPGPEPSEEPAPAPVVDDPPRRQRARRVPAVRDDATRDMRGEDTTRDMRREDATRDMRRDDAPTVRRPHGDPGDDLDAPEDPPTRRVPRPARDGG
jgi:hypothetical protein